MSPERAKLFSLSVTWDEPSEVVPVDLRLDLLDAWLENERRELLAPLELERTLEPIRQALDEAERQAQTDGPQQAPIDGVTGARIREIEAQAKRMKGFFGTSRPEDRSPSEYTAEVENYLREARAVATDQRMVKAAAVAGVKLGLFLVNPTERNFADIEIDMEIDAPILAARFSWIEDKSAPLLLYLPGRPRLWGTPRPPPWMDRIAVPLISPSATRPPRQPTMEIDDGSHCRIHWRAGSIRPSSRRTLEPVCLFIPPNYADGAIEASWRATASDAVGVASGSISFRLGADPVELSAEDLIERTGEWFHH